jgi:hypothetical protein
MVTEGSARQRLRIMFGVGLIIVAGLGILPGNGLAENKKPLAVINGTLNVKVRETVYLNGTMSSDPDGDSLNYTWTVLSWPKSGITLVGKSRRLQFDANTPGEYEIQLVVNDGSDDSDPVTVTVVVTDSP